MLGNKMTYVCEDEDKIKEGGAAMWVIYGK